MKELIQNYYTAFNQQNYEAMLDCLSDKVIHDVNEGAPEVGKDLFREFLKVMDDCYSESVEGLIVMADTAGKHLAAEFYIRGIYKKSQPGLPPANNQKYHIRVGAFFEIEDKKIKRVTNYYNLRDWIRQVSK